MSGGFNIVIFVALGAVLVALALGLFAMVRGGEFNRRHGNRLMRLRVGLQFGALVLIGIAFLLRDG